MKTLETAKRIHTRGCVVYTVLITAVYLLGASVDRSWLPTPGTVASLLLFSLYLAASAEFLFSDLLVGPLRVLIHFAVTLFVFWLTFCRMGGYLKNGGSFGTAFLVYLFAYILCAAVVLLSLWLTADLRKREKPYDSIFREKERPYTSQFGGGDGKAGKR